MYSTAPALLQRTAKQQCFQLTQEKTEVQGTIMGQMTEIEKFLLHNLQVLRVAKVRDWGWLCNQASDVSLQQAHLHEQQTAKAQGACECATHMKKECTTTHHTGRPAAARAPDPQDKAAEQRRAREAAVKVRWHLAHVQTYVAFTSKHLLTAAPRSKAQGSRSCSCSRPDQAPQCCPHPPPGNSCTPKSTG